MTIIVSLWPIPIKLLRALPSRSWRTDLREGNQPILTLWHGVLWVCCPYPHRKFTTAWQMCTNPVSRPYTAKR